MEVFMNLSPETAAEGVCKLALMAFFPGDPDTRAALVWALLQFVDTEEHLEWLVERALKLYTRWPGVGELRAVYCSRFKPADGQEAYSEIYQSGFPHQSPPPKVPPPRETITTADRGLSDQVRAAARAKRMPAVGRTMGAK
jgi:hypothetical protein